jgi:homopolymeric O-antigen transport system ATP-binding protein
VADRFDDIVAFSEIGEFIDLPVKRYSSGMYTRLAFSVSAHLAVEIMLVDEVLSVGDARFQDKSKAYIREMIKDGRTVLYVSHSMNVVSDLCDSAMVLEDGHIVFDGETDAAIDTYQELNRKARSEVRRLDDA